jgi:hypothetical protein
MLAALTLGLGACRDRALASDPEPPPPRPSAGTIPTAAALAAPPVSGSALPGATPPGLHDVETLWIGATGTQCVHVRDTLGGVGTTCGSMPEGRVWTAAQPHPGGRLMLDGMATGAERGSTADACCYRVGGPYLRRGRPLVVDGAAHVAGARACADWAEIPFDASANVGPELRLRLGAAWRADAAEEHASVAAFARLSLELLALGAPPELLVATTRAALDEVEHARVAYGLACAYDGEPSGPAPLAEAMAPLRAPTLATVAVDALLGGCVGEGTAALVARAGSDRARDPRVAAVLARVAEDETRHAELAWRILGWALAEGGDEVRAAVRSALDAWAPPAARGGDDEVGLAEHGRVDAREVGAISRAVVREIVSPLLATSAAA